MALRRSKNRDLARSFLETMARSGGGPQRGPSTEPLSGALNQVVNTITPHAPAPPPSGGVQDVVDIVAPQPERPSATNELVDIISTDLLPGPEGLVERETDKLTDKLWEQLDAPGKAPEVNVTDALVRSRANQGTTLLTKADQGELLHTNDPLKSIAVSREAAIDQASGGGGLADELKRDLRGAAEQRQGQRLDARQDAIREVLGGLTPEGYSGSDADVQAMGRAAIKASRKAEAMGFEHVDPSLLLAVTGQESGFGTNEGPSSAGARGPGQFIPGTAATYEEKTGADPWSENNVEALIPVAAYLSDLGAGGNASREQQSQALEGYTGGYSDEMYNDPVLNAAAAYEAAGLDRFAGGRGQATGPGGSGRQLSVDELFYDPGTNIVDNQPSGAIGHHGTHVHFGSENQRDLIRAALIAERLGGDVRENPLFETVDPVHTEGSMHYDEEALKPGLRRLAERAGGSGDEIGAAIDIQGSPDVLMAIDEALARRAGAALSPSGGASSYGTGFSSGAGIGGLEPQAVPGSREPSEPGANFGLVELTNPTPTNVPMAGIGQDDEFDIEAILEELSRRRR